MIIDDVLGNEDDLVLPMGDDTDPDENIVISEPELPIGLSEEDREVMISHNELFGLLSIIIKELEENPRPDSLLIQQLTELHQFEEPGFLVNMVNGPSPNNHPILTKAVGEVKSAFGELLGRYSKYIEHSIASTIDKFDLITEDKLKALEMLYDYLKSKSAKVMVSQGEVKDLLVLPFSEVEVLVQDTGLWVDDMSSLSTIITEVMEMSAFNIRDITNFLLDLYTRVLDMKTEMNDISQRWKEVNENTPPKESIGIANRVEMINNELDRAIKYTVTNNTLALINSVFRNYM